MPAAPQTPALYWNELEPRAIKYRSWSRIQNLSLPTQCRVQQSKRLEDKESTTSYYLQPGRKLFSASKS